MIQTNYLLGLYGPKTLMLAVVQLYYNFLPEFVAVLSVYIRTIRKILKDFIV